MYEAQLGQASWCNKKSISVSDTDHVSLVKVAYARGYSQEMKERLGQVFPKLVILANSTPNFRSAALHLAWVADGRLDAAISLGNPTWDTAAGRFLVQQAGGMVSSIGPDLLATNGKIHQPLLELLA